MQKHRHISRIVRYTCMGLPLAGAAASVLFPLRELARQFMVLAALLWFQFYLMFEIPLAPK